MIDCAPLVSTRSVQRAKPWTSANCTSNCSVRLRESGFRNRAVVEYEEINGGRHGAMAKLGDGPPANRDLARCDIGFTCDASRIASCCAGDGAKACASGITCFRARTGLFQRPERFVEPNI